MSKPKVEERKRVTSRFCESDFMRIAYWAEKHDLTVSEYVHDAVLLTIAHENGDWGEIPDIIVQRLNQLISNTEVLNRNVNSVGEMVESSMDSLLSLTRGDNYLLDDEDGIL